ncbi:MFS transporter [Ktedonosporobacter rubrisoli]|nr:MFS transporter [Ktedonosporobacter rubrisoli]
MYTTQAGQRNQLNMKTSGMQWWTLVACACGYFMVILDTTVVNVALPAIQRALGTNISDLQWVTASYTLAFASLLLMTGTLSDRYGSKRIFLAGLLVFTLSSALCGTAPMLSVFLIARVFQGIGAALLVPASLAIISNAYPDGRKRASAIGVWAMIAAIAASAGPVIGGLLVEDAGWRTIFFINLPVGVIGMVITWRFVTEAGRSAHGSLDIWGQMSAILALAALTFALIEGEPMGWNASPVLLAFLLCVASGIAFVLIELRSASPMLPLTLFRSATFSATTSVGLLLNFSFYGLLFLLSIFYQQAKGYSAWETGLHLLPLTLINVAAMPLAGQLTARFGPRVPVLGGLALCAAGIFAYLSIGESLGYWLVVVFFLAIGFGGSSAVPALTAALLGAVARRYSGIASGVLNASRQAGGTFGVAILGSIFSSMSGSAALTGMHIALGVAGVVLLLSCAITLLWIPSRFGKAKEEGEAV